MSTTIESQPQRAMLSAEAELGMPSQPFTATPPFFQRVLSLFSRKAVSPMSFVRGEDGHGCDARSIRCCAEPPCAGILRPSRWRGAPLHKEWVHESEQEESDAAAHHGQGGLGR